MSSVNWDEKVVEDYSERIIIDPDSPILTFKASRDRYTNLTSQKEYAGLPYLGSWHSEDALTWNIFRSLQKAESLDIITDRLRIGHLRGLLFWTLSPDMDEVNTELQYVVGSLIRKYDGVLRGQTTEPDIIMLGTRGIAVIECKLGESKKTISHFWEGSIGSVERRLDRYLEEVPQLVKTRDSRDIVPVYQLARMAFYAVNLGEHFQVEPVVVSLANETNWNMEIHKLGKSPAELWDTFCNRILGKDSPRCENLYWQAMNELIRGTSLDVLSDYLLKHPCLGFVS